MNSISPYTQSTYQAPRFQFSLRDLLLFSALTGVGLALFVSFLTFGRIAWYPPYLGPEAKAAMQAGGLLLVGLAVAGGTAGIWLAKRQDWRGWRRGAMLTSSIALFWAPLLAFEALRPNFIRSRMAANESQAIAACKYYAEAQDIYRRTDWDGDGVLEYAQKFTWLSGLGPSPYSCDVLIPRSFALAEGLPGIARPYNGYVFKVLKGQGPNAPGGRKSYLVPSADGKSMNMVLGYGLAACPAEYGFSGINSFILNNTGTVYQQDLGPNTPEIFSQMTEYSPDSTWVVEE